MRDAGDVIELRYAVIKNRIVFSAFVAAAFPGQHMQKLRPLTILHFVQRIDEQIYVVAINRPDVVKSQRRAKRDTGGIDDSTLLPMLRTLSYVRLASRRDK